MTETKKYELVKSGDVVLPGDEYWDHRNQRWVMVLDLMRAAGLIRRSSTPVTRDELLDEALAHLQDS